MKYILICLSFLIAGCSTGIPEHHRVVLNNLNQPKAYNQINQYNQLILQKADIVSAITFNFRGRALSALGITELDSENNSFSVAALSPMGMTLFKLKREKGELVSRYIMPQFGPKEMDKTAEMNKMPDMINNDIALIYFNRNLNLPESVSVPENFFDMDKYGVTIHTQANNQAGNKNYQYIFSGNPLKLIKKSMLENKTKIWSVDYYDYKNVGSKEIPYKIFFKNYTYGYTIDIQTIDIQTNHTQNGEIKK
ncbi:MAG: DUF3261 domain-containing protein [Pseudomonadota bacterium]